MANQYDLSDYTARRIYRLIFHVIRQAGWIKMRPCLVYVILTSWNAKTVSMEMSPLDIKNTHTVDRNDRVEVEHISIVSNPTTVLQFGSVGKSRVAVPMRPGR